MACRIITSPLTGERVESKTWNDLYRIIFNEGATDRVYNYLLSKEFIDFFGNWIDPKNSKKPVSKAVNELGEPLLVYRGGVNKDRKSYDRDIIFFADDYKMANDFRIPYEYDMSLIKDPEDPGIGRVYSAFVYMKNPKYEFGYGLAFKEFDDSDSFIISSTHGEEKAKEYIVLKPKQVLLVQDILGYYPVTSDNKLPPIDYC